MGPQTAMRPAADRQQISGFILAGGRSYRLGRDKVLLPWQGATLLQHAINRLLPLCANVSICSSRPDLRRKIPGPYSVIPDALPNAGPLGGIVPALELSPTDWNFFLAVDLPFVPLEFLRALTQRPITPALAIIPVVEKVPQPLCGMYHRGLATGLRRALVEGNYKIMLSLRNAMETPALQLELLDARELAARGQVQLPLPVEDWFLNINTPQDWQRAMALSLL